MSSNLGNLFEQHIIISLDACLVVCSPYSGQVPTTVQFSSVTHSCLTLCDPMDSSTPGLPVHHQLPEFAQTHIHWVSDAIQRSHPLSSPSPPALNLSQYQGLFKWVSSLHQVAKVLEFQLQHQTFQETLKSSPTPQFKSINSLALSFLYSPHPLSYPYMTTGKIIALNTSTFISK